MLCPYSDFGFTCSNSVNGKPTCLDPVMKAARNIWNFSGYVTSDSDSIADAYASHHYVSSAAAASCGGVKDGQCDIDSGNTYYGNLLEGVKRGLCTMEDVDRAVFNTLKIRFDLGLFVRAANAACVSISPLVVCIVCFAHLLLNAVL